MGAPAENNTENNSVSFSAAFPRPLLDTAKLNLGESISVHSRFKITNNSTSALRFSTYRSIQPVLLDANGDILAFEFGNNVSRLPREADYPFLAPGGSLIVPIEATLTREGERLLWRTLDGTVGSWTLTSQIAPFRFRLSYRQISSEMQVAQKTLIVLKGFWVGEGVTQSVDTGLEGVGQ